MATLPRLGGPSLNNANAITLTSGAAHTKGSWTQLVASTTGPVAWLAIQVQPGTVTAPIGLLFDIGVGGAGSETVVIPNLFLGNSASNPTAAVTYVVPFNIPAGSRIAARCQDNVGSGTMVISVQTLAPGGDGFSGAGRIEACGPDTATSRLAQVDPGGSAGTKGTYAQLIASTSFAYRWLLFAAGHARNAAASTTTWRIDLAVGASSSEQIIIPDIFAAVNTGTDYEMITFGVPYAIAAGSRIATRASASITDATDRIVNVAVWGCG